MKQLWVLLLATLVAACSSGGASPSSPPTPSGRVAPSPSPSLSPDPTRLVGLWSVLDTKPDQPGVAVTFGGEREQLIVWEPCGQLLGSWTADATGAFLGTTDGWSQACSRRDQKPPLAGWLEAARSYQLDGAQVVLLDAHRQRLARLVRQKSVRPGRDVDPALATPPTVTAAIRAGLAPPKLPAAGDRPVTAAALYGRWLPAPVRHFQAGQPHVVFQSDARWTGSDGCNAQGGRWLLSGKLDSAGSQTLLTLGGPSTLIGCDGVAVGSWLVQARSLRFHGAELVLYDRNARRIGALVRRP